MRRSAAASRPKRAPRGRAPKAVVHRRKAALLRQAGRDRDVARFVAGVAHDIAAPLTQIAAAVDAALDDCADALPADVRAMLRLAVARAERTRVLSSRLFEYATAADLSGSTRLAPLSTAVATALASASEAVRSQGVSVSVRPLPRVLVDPVLIGRVFELLLDNAVAHAGVRPLRVTIDADKSSDGWRIAVVDNGKGVPPRFAEKIFDSGTRLGDGAAGLGMGLPLCRRIMHLHGGDLRLDAGAAGGARFVLEFPGARQTPIRPV